MIGGQALQRTHADERGAVPYRPQADFGRFESREVERVRAARRGFGPSSGRMQAHKIEHARVAEIARNDAHHDPHSRDGLGSGLRRAAKATARSRSASPPLPA
jgi:hypothetical protein